MRSYQETIKRLQDGAIGDILCAKCYWNGGQIWVVDREPTWSDKDANPYRQEHEDLIASIRAGNPLNEARAVAESTLTGIMGREAVYSGQELDWDTALQSTARLGPEKYEFGPFPVPDVAMPGVYRLS